jgi:hypothetical protein
MVADTGVDIGNERTWFLNNGHELINLCAACPHFYSVHDGR